MLPLTNSLSQEPDFSKLLSAINSKTTPAVLSGLSEIHRAHAISALRTLTGRPIVVLCSDDGEAVRLSRDISTFTGEIVATLGYRDFMFHNAEVVSRQLEQARLHTLYGLACNNNSVIVMSVSGALMRTIPPDLLFYSTQTIQFNGSYDVHGLIEKLNVCGYSRSEQVEGPGHFSLRGGILDFFSPAHEYPIRCEFFGDEIDSMSFFDITSQRRTDSIDSATIVPVAEVLPSLYQNSEFGSGNNGFAKELESLASMLSKIKNPNTSFINQLQQDIDRLNNNCGLPSCDKYLEIIYPMATALDYLSDDAIVFISDPNRCTERADNYLKGIGEDTVSLLEKGALDSRLVRFCENYESFLSRIEKYSVVMSDSFLTGSYPLVPKTLISLTTKRLSSYGGSLETAQSDISHYISSGFKTVILCHDKRRADSLRAFMQDKGISTVLDYSLQSLPQNGTCVVSVGSISAGLEYPSLSLAILTEGQFIAAQTSSRSKFKSKSNRERVQSFSDLTPGDLVVHEHHGIGRFVGIFKLPVDGIEKDFIKIAYSGTDFLYVPATQLDMVAKYIGAGNDSPIKLSKMGGTDWHKAKSRAKTAAKELAGELIKLYSERKKVKGHAFSPDSVWQTEFEERFGYQETEDQLRCVTEIKADMEINAPMDRLLCGDVGFGKTEIALRAVMKCVLDGYQAAVLVPTTVLAQQHYVTMVRRFSGYPIKIELLSRFKTASDMKLSIREIERGGADIVIGTHRLIQKDVKFKKLGLLVVDEEQRFGVSHKEKLKEISKSVDVLTLSATPIPRTLNMALSGIRDMSTIENPPMNRQPVQTYVMEHDWGLLADAIRREVSRGGQVFYLHNRVDNIERVTVRLRELIDGISVAVAHGRMDEETLSDVMERMVTGEVSVLVCTTIIESGIDIPNVNTLIVEDADKLGLAQLHQIRGRVGRSPRRAYAYLTFRRGKVLSEIAEKRLSAIREFAEFNAGFKIAMRDLEIRGAGSLLGAEQSGHLVSVGYDMYLKLLEEAVTEQKGEKSKSPAECSADLTVSASIPEKYVTSDNQRMDLYRRIARIRTMEDSDEMVSELIDRFGDPPKQVLSLIKIALMRGEASNCGISEITQKDGWIRLKLTDFDMERISKLYTRNDYKGRIRILAGAEPAVALKLKHGEVVDEALKFIRLYGTINLV